MITAAVDESTAALSATVSSRGTNCTSNGVRGKPYHDLSAPQVTAAAAAVRPWKLCSIATIFGRPVTLQRDPQRVLVRLGAAIHEEHAADARRRERRQRVGGLVANVQRQRVRLEHEIARRARDRFGQARMAVAERRHRMPAIEIEHAPALRVLEPHAGAFDRRERQHRVDLVEMRVHRGHLVVHRDIHHSHPAAGAVNPISSGNPSKRFAHWMLPPAAPLSRLSSTEQTTIVSPSASACNAA